MTFSPPTTTHDFAPTQIARSSEVNINYDDITEQFLLGTYESDGWRVGTFELVYNSANSLETATDVDVTGVLQEGMKITFEQATNGEYFGFITKVDYNTTVSNRSYVEVYAYNQTDIVDEAILVDTLGFSRFASPANFPPRGDSGWELRVTSGSDYSDSTPPTSFAEVNSALRLTIPTGIWEIDYRIAFHVRDSSGTVAGGQVAVSSSATSVSNEDLISFSSQQVSSSGDVRQQTSMNAKTTENLSSSTTFYTIWRILDGDFLQLINSRQRFVLRARPAYS